VAKAVGENSPISLQTKFLVAMIIFTIDSLRRLSSCTKRRFDKHSIHQGKSHSLALGSQYTVAVGYQSVNDLEIAECVLPVLDLLQIPYPELTLLPSRNHLRDILANNCVTMECRNRNVTRTKLKLSILLRAQNRPGEAPTMREEIVKIFEIIRPASG